MSVTIVDSEEKQTTGRVRFPHRRVTFLILKHNIEELKTDKQKNLS